MTGLRICLSAVLICTSLLTTAQNWKEKSEGPDVEAHLQGLSDQYFGKSLYIDGDYAVIGAEGHNSNQGIAYVLFNSGEEWKEIAQLTASDGSSNEAFGSAVSISGDVVVVGAKWDYAKGAYSGSAYIFEKPTGGWEDMTQTAKLTASDGTSFGYFGTGVSIFGNTVVVGAPGNVIFDVSTMGAAYVFEKPDDGWKDMTETAKIMAFDETLKDDFGQAVSNTEDLIVVGAQFEDDGGASAGAAYLYEKPIGGWTDMHETAKLTASDAAAGDQFGCSVSVSEGQLIIGAFGTDAGGSASGSAYIFQEPVDGWDDMTQTAKLSASDAANGDYFGRAVGISGDQIIVGAYGDDDGMDGAGSVYYFEKPIDGWEDATESAKFLANEAGPSDLFGYAVAISGDQILIGAYQDDDNGKGSGSAYLFEMPVDGWVNATEDYKLAAPKTMGAIDDNTGWAVAIDGEYAVIGAPNYDIENGVAYVMFYNGSEWTKEAKLTASDGANYQRFGYSVAISGEQIVIGAYGDDANGSYSGSAYVFEMPSSGWEDMTQTAKLLPSDGESNDNFGFSVSISGEDIVVGAFGDDDNGSSAGAAYIFEMPGNSWVDMSETAKLTAEDGEANDYFGYSVFNSNETVIIGAYGDDDNGSSSGAAYIFKKPNSGWTEITHTAKLLASDGTTNDYLGKSVSIDGEQIVLGARGDDDAGPDTGAAYLYEMPDEGWEDMNETVKLKASDAAASDDFGQSVSIAGDYVLVGAYGDDLNKGSVHLFTKPAAGWENLETSEKFANPNGMNGDYYGWSVSISEQFFLVGAYGIDDEYMNSGSAYLYKDCMLPAPDDLVLEALTAECSITPDNPTATNNCGEQFTGVSDVSFPITEIGDHVITWTYTDNDGNSVQQTQDVTIELPNNEITKNGLTLKATGSDYAYQWMNCNNQMIEGATSQEYTPEVTGSYYVEISIGYCQIDSECIDVFILNATDQIVSPSVIYPNPVVNKMSVNLQDYPDATIKLLSLDGRLQVDFGSRTEKIAKLSIPSLNAGIYILQIQSALESTEFKILIEQ